jgi:uncharacterized phage-associated protein
MLSFSCHTTRMALRLRCERIHLTIRGIARRVYTKLVVSLVKSCGLITEKMEDREMANIFDVAKYILEKYGPMTAMKLQKLTYYAKAWGLVWDEEEMFTEEFQAWANGAVAPALYDRHRHLFIVTPELFPDDNSGALSQSQRDTVDRVLDFYGKYTAQQLSDINHQEDPWKDARGGIPPTARSTSVITPAAMAEYYSGIWNEREAK